jgi:hypothetical protein
MKCLPSVPAQSGSACQEGNKDGDLHGHVEFGWKNSSNSSNQLNRRSLRRYKRNVVRVVLVRKFVEKEALNREMSEPTSEGLTCADSFSTAILKSK